MSCYINLVLLEKIKTFILKSIVFFLCWIVGTGTSNVIHSRPVWDGCILSSIEFVETNNKLLLWIWGPEGCPLLGKLSLSWSILSIRVVVIERRYGQ